MIDSKLPYRFIFGAGGTGGHLYPALAVAETIKTIKPESEIMFVGTKDKIEATVVPQRGFPFRSIWIRGVSRKFNLKVFIFPVQLFISFLQALIIAIRFKPKVAIGSGAYVSGPVAWTSSILGAKIILLEQNSVPGITNRLLESKAEKIFVSFEETKQYFRNQKKITFSGNPIGIDLKLVDKTLASRELDLDPNKKTILILGGSLGALSINEAVVSNLGKFQDIDIQIIWQTGKNYLERYIRYKSERVKIFPFIDNMSSAYSAADVVIARAGATTIAELAYLGLAAVLVPSPNVASDHQTMNARNLFENNAVELIIDSELDEKLFDVVTQLIKDEKKLGIMRKSIQKFSNRNAAKMIADYTISLVEGKSH